MSFLKIGSQSLTLPFHIAWFETRVRYARSVLGPFWITIQTTVFVVAVGSLMAGVFGSDIATYMAYFSVSYVMWIFFSSTILDSTSLFSGVNSFIRDRAKKPKTFIILPFCRQLIYLAHNIIIPFSIFIYFGVGSIYNLALAIPGLILFFMTVFLITAPISVLCVRYRDGRPIIESSMNLLFLLSPILWPPAAVESGARFVLSYNPLAHLLAVWRDPLVNGHIPVGSMIIAVAINIGLAILFVFSLRQSRRVPLWL